MHIREWEGNKHHTTARHITVVVDLIVVVVTRTGDRDKRQGGKWDEDAGLFVIDREWKGDKHHSSVRRIAVVTRSPSLSLLSLPRRGRGTSAALARERRTPFQLWLPGSGGDNRKQHCAS